MQKQRNNYLDVLKGLLIFLVVLGHFIQYVGYGTNSDCFHNWMFKLIYIFHMPLFLGISGYLSFFSVKKYSFIEFIKRRISNLIFPMITWCLINSFIAILLKKPDQFSDMLDISLNVTLYDYWFIWAIIAYSCIIAILAKYRMDRPIILIIVCVLFMTLKSGNFLYNVLESMFPFYVVGYFAAKTNINKIIAFCQKYVILFVVSSAICLYIWKPIWFVYFTPSTWHNIDVTFIRLFAGIVISISFMLAIHVIYKKIPKSSLSLVYQNLGKESLTIYLVQGAVFLITTHSFYIRLINSYNVIVLIVPALLLTIILYGFVKITSMNKIVSQLLYGKKY